MLDDLMQRSTVVQAFVEGATSGSPVRCGVVVAPGGYGKSSLATEAAAALKAAEIPVTLVVGDLALDVDLSTNSEGSQELEAIIVDAADLAPDSVIELLRAEIADLNSGRSVLLFTRSISASPSLATLCSAADRESMLEELDGFTQAEVKDRLAKGSSISVDEMHALTASVPALVDRLCQGWDDEAWPDEPGVSAEDLPKRFLRHIEMELSRLDADARRRMAAGAVLAVVAPDADPDLHDLVPSGLVGPDGQMPMAVAHAVDRFLDDGERREAVTAAAQPLIHTDPTRAAELFESVRAADLAAIALAAAGRPDDATTKLVDLPPVGAAAAAGAHVAGAESRWDDAVALLEDVGEAHPYRSLASLDGVRAIYSTIAGDGPGFEAKDFASSAAGAMRDALAASTGDEVADVVDHLRGLARQAKNQPPVLDVAITGSELAALAAITVGDFDLARTMLDASPESPDRSALSSALQGWISARTGQTPDFADAPSSIIAAETLRLAAELIEARRTSDADSTVETVNAIAGLVSQMSVDLLTFDALCEVHVASHRADARKQARQLGDGLERFATRRNSQLLAIRLGWSQIEAALASGDDVALGREVEKFQALDGVGDLTPALVAAAGQWVAVLNESVDAAALREALNELEAAGHVWEAAALAGQAAIRTSDGELAKELLAIGRSFRAAAPEAKVTSPAGLSEREIEIGLLVLKGHSYKEIGAECFISPKTVEHHVSHIRQKLVAVGVPRAEFRAKLQADLQP